MDGARRQTFFRPPAAATTTGALRPDRLRWPARPTAWSYKVVIAASFLTILAPFLVVSVPPLVDYPNHLARFWLLAGGANDPALSPYFRVDWSKASTNIGVDLMVTGLSVLAPARLVGFVAALAAAAGPPMGLICLSRVIFNRFHPWQVLFPLAAWTTTFLMGFLNFQTGIGLALVLAAADPWMLRRLGVFVGPARTVLAAFLAIDHPYALLFYAVVVGALAFGAAPPWPGGWRVLLSRIAGAVRASAWCVVPLLALVVLAPALPGADPQSASVGYGRPFYKVFALLTPLSAYNVVIGLALTATLVGASVWLVRRGALRIHAGLALAGLALVGLSLLAPDRAGGGSWIAQRFPTLALLVLLGSARLTTDATARWGARFVAPALVLVAVQSAWVTWNWRAMEADMSAVRRAIAAVEPGARILPLQHEPTLAVQWSAPSGRYMSSLGDPTFRHYAALATPLRRAFVPNLFSARGLQPLQVVGDWDVRVEHNGGPLSSVSALARPWRESDPPYLRGWRSRFDYLLVVNADLPDAGGAFRSPKGVILVCDAGFAQLWKIRRR
jgi:hypothetical protein